MAALPLRGGRGVSPARRDGRAAGKPARRDAHALFEDTDATLLDLVYVRLSALVSAADKMRRILAE